MFIKWRNEQALNVEHTNDPAIIQLMMLGILSMNNPIAVDFLTFLVIILTS